MAKTKRFGRVYHTAQSGDIQPGDGEEGVSEGVRQNSREDVGIEEKNNDSRYFLILYLTEFNCN